MNANSESLGPFVRALESLFNRFGFDATFLPQGESPTPVKVLTREPDVVVDLGESQIIRGGIQFELRTADVPPPRAGDHLTVADQSYRIVGEPMADRDRLTWTLECVQEAGS
ncbi:MAG: hypothetical protein HQL53_14360 [Magnetococcales bacterium]|nr:hypothetical protein [Magnetococcales bacterium]